MRFRPIQTSALLFAVASGCTSLHSASRGNGLAEDTHAELKMLPCGQAEFVPGQLTEGEYCRFVFTEDLPQPPPGSSFATDDRTSPIRVKMGGRVVSIHEDHVKLAEVVEIIDTWSPNPRDILLSPSLFTKHKQFAVQPLSGNPNKELTFLLRKIDQAETIDRSTWAAFCDSAFRKPAPPDFAYDLP